MKKLSFEAFASRKIQPQQLNMIKGGWTDTTWSQGSSSGGDITDGSTTHYDDGASYSHSSGQWITPPQ